MDYLDSIAINVDAVKMEQVLRNFLSNALKFSPKGSEVVVKVSVSPTFSKLPDSGKSRHIGEKGVLRVAVHDRGPGISKVCHS